MVGEAKIILWDEGSVAIPVSLRDSLTVTAGTISEEEVAEVVMEYLVLAGDEEISAAEEIVIA